jgi:hypothetical protein
MYNRNNRLYITLPYITLYYHILQYITIYYHILPYITISIIEKEYLIP